MWCNNCNGEGLTVVVTCCRDYLHPDECCNQPTYSQKKCPICQGTGERESLADDEQPTQYWMKPSQEDLDLPF